MPLAGPPTGTSLATGCAFVTGMGFGMLAGLACEAITGFRRALTERAGLRAGPALAVSFAFCVDLAALAGLAIRDVVGFLVA